MNPQDCRPTSMLANAGAPIASKAPLDQAIVTLDASADLLANHLTELYARLEPLMSQTVNKAQPSPIPAQPGSSIVVEKLHQVTQRIEFMVESLLHIRSRLEV